MFTGIYGIEKNYSDSKSISPLKYVQVAPFHVNLQITYLYPVLT